MQRKYLCVADQPNVDFTSAPSAEKAGLLIKNFIAHFNLF
jgi:hypothetical protein